MTFWYGLWAPGGTPKDIIAKLNAAVADAFDDPAVRARLTEQGHDIPTRQTAHARSARRAPQGRNREMVAGHQGRRHQAAMKFRS